MASEESRRAAELRTLRAELVKRLARLDCCSQSLRPALTKMAQQVEGTIRRLAA